MLYNLLHPFKFLRKKRNERQKEEKFLKAERERELLLEKLPIKLDNQMNRLEELVFNLNPDNIHKVGAPINNASRIISGLCFALFFSRQKESVEVYQRALRLLDIAAHQLKGTDYARFESERIKDLIETAKKYSPEFNKNLPEEILAYAS